METNCFHYRNKVFRTLKQNGNKIKTKQYD